jgi:hypothetical protein
LRMQPDQEPLQNCTIIRQYVDVQRGQSEHLLLTFQESKR